jgi:hypothetical protein
MEQENWISPIAWSPLDAYRGSGRYRLKNNLHIKSRMKTAKYTEEQRKERRATRNKNYYEKNKEFWTEYNGCSYSVYALSGFVNNMVWVGITRTLKRSLSDHKKTFGDNITAEVLFTFNQNLTDENKADILAILARHYSSRCLNPVDISAVDFSAVTERMKPIISELSETDRQNFQKIDRVPA